MTRRAVVIVAAAMAVGIFASVRGLVGASGDEGRFRVARDRGYAGFGAAEEGAWRGSYYFVQLADPQLGMLRRDRSWSEELDMLRLAIEHVNRLRPRFVIVSGDLVNAFPEEDGDAAAREGEGEALEGALAELDARVGLVLQPGNHDLGQAPTAASIRAYVDRFGDDYASFWVGGVKYVSLNSQLVKNGSRVPRLRDAHARWAKATFAAARRSGAKHVVVLSHVAPFVGDASEATGWANWPSRPRRAFLDDAERAGVTLWLCGHLHGAAVARRGRVEVVTNSAVGSLINWTRAPSDVAPMPKPDFADPTVVGDPKVVATPKTSGLRIVRVGADGFRHRWYPLADVPASFEDVDFEMPRARPRPSTPRRMKVRRVLARVLSRERPGRAPGTETRHGPLRVDADTAPAGLERLD